jgi:hypothetical protein
LSESLKGIYHVGDRRKYEDNAEISLRKILCGDINWVTLPQGRVKVTTGIGLWFHKTIEFLE